MKVKAEKKVSQRELESASIGEIRATGDDTIAVAHSAAKRNLEALLDNSLPALEPVTICDVQFYIKRLGYTDIAKLALSINRDAEGTLQLEPKDRKPESIVAKVMILACVCEEDGSSYFTREDLETYFDNPQLVEVFTGLMEECNRVNPCILNTLKKT